MALKQSMRARVVGVAVVLVAMLLLLCWPNLRIAMLSSYWNHEIDAAIQKGMTYAEFRKEVATHVEEADERPDGRLEATIIERDHPWCLYQRIRIVVVITVGPSGRISGGEVAPQAISF